MKPLETRWRLLLGTLTLVAAWGAIAPASLILTIGLLSAFGCVIAWVQYSIEARPD